MGVSTFTQPNYATQGGSVYPTAIDDAVAVMARPAAAFAAHESDPLAMTVEVDAGAVFAGGTLSEVAAQTTAALVAPTTDPRIDRIVIDATTGTAEVVQGAEDVAPSPPSIPAGKRPVCQVALTVGMTEVTNADLTDERVGAGGGEGLNPGTPTELTIDTGAVTVTGGYHTLRSEGGAGTDNVDTIDVTALPVGGLLILAAGDAGEVPTLRDGVDNITLQGPDFALDSLDKRIALQKLSGGDVLEVFRSPGSAPLLHVRDEKTAGTDGGSFNSGSFQTRDLNTVMTNEIAGASLSSNQITLPAGVYEIDASAPAYACEFNKLRLRNVTDGADLVIGTSEFARLASTNTHQIRAFVTGRFTLTGTKVLELQHRCSTTASTVGLGRGVNLGVVEVFSDVLIRRVG